MRLRHHRRAGLAGDERRHRPDRQALEGAQHGRTNLKALLLETSFPNKLQELADISGHLTPQTLRGELGKFQRNGAEVLLYHLKPAFVAELKRSWPGSR